MTKKSPDTAPTSAEPPAVPVTADRLAAARAWMTPERLAALEQAASAESGGGEDVLTSGVTLDEAQSPVAGRRFTRT